MKVDSINVQLNTQQKQQSNKNNPKFTGLADGTLGLLNYLNTNQAWGANAVDFFCMVLPRTVTDFGRGPEAGLETARRESMGTINDSAVGAYGTLAGMALAMGINKFYGLDGKSDVKLGSVFADSETLDMMGSIWTNKIKAAQNNPQANPLREFLKDTINNYEALSPNNKGQWVRFSEEHNANIEKAVDILEKEIKSDSNKLDKVTKKNIQRILASTLGVENSFRIIAKEGAKEHSSRYTLESIVENCYNLGKVFNKDKVKEAFIDSANITDNTFIRTMKNLNRNRSLAGVGIATAVGCSVQPINMWLTKRKTGGEGFVGGGKKDDSMKFKLEKLAVAAVFGLGVIATIGNPKNLMKNLQFKGFTPTINQLKFIYGATIMSRFLAARNENELKESSIKDMLGFANWLILGNFVSKLVAQSFEKSLIKQEKVGGILNWIGTSSLKTMEEVMQEALKGDIFKENGKAMNFSEMLKKIPKGSQAAKNIKYLTIAQLAGYLYSGIVLGVGIPKLNIYLTKRRMAREAQNQNNQPETMLNPQNREFLNQQYFKGNKILGLG